MYVLIANADMMTTCTALRQPRKLQLRDDQMKKLVAEKFGKKELVCGERNNNSQRICNVFVTPVKVSFVSLSSFGFESCVLPFKGVKRRRVVYFFILYYTSIYLVPIQMHKSRTMMII